MSVITWQNVTGTAPRDLAGLMSIAKEGLSGGFETGARVLTDVEKNNQKTLDMARDQAEADYSNLVQSYKTPEDMSAAKMSGIFDARLAALHPKNQALVRGAVDARSTSLENQALATNLFLDKDQDYRTQSIHDEIKGAQGAGLFDKAQAIMDANPGLRNMAPYVTAGSPENRARYKQLADAAKFAESQRLTLEATTAAENKKKDATAQQILANVERDNQTSAQESENKQLATQKEAETFRAEAAFSNEVESLKTDSITRPKREADYVRTHNFNLPFNQDGTLNMSLIKGDVAKERVYSEAMKAGGFTRAQTDTERFNAFQTAYARKGPGAAAAMRAVTLARGGEFTSDPIAMLTGADRSNLDAKLSGIDRITELNKQNNSLFIDGKNPTEGLAKLVAGMKEQKFDETDIRLVREEISRRLREDPTSPINIPNILTAASTSQSWNPLTNTKWLSGFRANFNRTLNEIEATPAYVNQVVEYHTSKGLNPVTMKQQAIKEQLRASRIPHGDDVQIPAALLGERSNTTPPPAAKK